MTKFKYSPCIVCGRLLGTFDGWDQVSDSGIVFYNFKPTDKCSLPFGDLCVDFDKGLIEYFNEFGKLIASFDLIDAIAGLERVQP